MHLRLALNLLHFLPALDVLYALRRAPNLYEIHPRYNKLNKKGRKMKELIYKFEPKCEHQNEGWSVY
jgi:hypothetical protein